LRPCGDPKNGTLVLATGMSPSPADYRFSTRGIRQQWVPPRAIPHRPKRQDPATIKHFPHDLPFQRKEFHIMDDSPPTTVARGPTILNDWLCSRCKELTTYEELYKISQGEYFEHRQFGEICESLKGDSPCPVCAAIKGLIEGPKVNPISHVFLAQSVFMYPESLTGLSRGLVVKYIEPSGKLTHFNHHLQLIANEGKLA